MQIVGRTFTLFSGIILLFLTSCESGVQVKGGTSPGPPTWLVPIWKINDSGSGIDGIPALENPKIINADQAHYLNGEDLVIGFKSGEEIRAYPHKILDWHEIINDEAGLNHVAITYCPLTGTGVAWDRKGPGRGTTFGVSGLLYESNLLPYDRNTQSLWSQMLQVCINGDLMGDVPEQMVIVETTWDTWKEMYPQTSVVSPETGFDRDYETYPYFNFAGLDYRTNSFLISPISVDDSRLPRKERVHGVVASQDAVRVYRFNLFRDQIRIYEDTYKGEEIFIIGSEKKNFIMSFKRRLPDGTLLSLNPLQNKLPIMAEDNEGTQWNLFGEAVFGPRKGEELTPTTSYMGFWFSFGTTFRETEIYSPNN